MHSAWFGNGQHILAWVGIHGKCIQIDPSKELIAFLGQDRSWIRYSHLHCKFMYMYTTYNPYWRGFRWDNSQTPQPIYIYIYPCICSFKLNSQRSLNENWHLARSSWISPQKCSLSFIASRRVLQSRKNSLLKWLPWTKILSWRPQILS